MRQPMGTVLALVGTCVLGVTTVPAIPVARPAAVTNEPDPGGIRFTEHRYRIIGKLRMVVFWASRDDVGSARMTSRSDGMTNTLTFLVGSNPQRAPRNLNEWSYLREEVQPTHASVFVVRSLETEEDGSIAPGAVADAQRFGASCASITHDAVRSVQTKVQARGVTYWMFDRLLDQVAAAPEWEHRHMSRPAGAFAGFLTAMQHVIRAGRADARGQGRLEPVSYVYNDAVYDLSVRGSDRLGRTRIGTRTFDRLIRTDFTILNRTTGDVSRFGVTYSPDRTVSTLPVQIFYQPSFWLRIELRLDDDANVPVDPTADGSVLTRIRAICAGAARP